MGNGSSKPGEQGPRYFEIVRSTEAPAAPVVVEPATQQLQPVATTGTADAAAQPSTGSCPMNKWGLGSRKQAQTDAAATGSSSSGCPMSESAQTGAPSSAKYMNPTQYNVYGQKIDPSNNMPVTPAQQPAAAQSTELSTERVVSTIPKGGNEGTWVYPSPQMFWNALSRKGKVLLLLLSISCSVSCHITSKMMCRLLQFVAQCTSKAVLQRE
jgi:Cytochrome c/c1 heme lyase